jgi:hypothetical protein
MKFQIPKDWLLARVQEEEGQEIGAGVLSRINLRALAKWEQACGNWERRRVKRRRRRYWMRVSNRWVKKVNHP